MAHWLFKSEPSAWSFEKLAACGAEGTDWSGVRNHSAKLNMQAMKVGEQGFFYHSQRGQGDRRDRRGLQGLPARPDRRDRQIRHGRHSRRPAAAASGDARSGEGREAARDDGAGHQFAPVGAAGDRSGMGADLRDGRPLREGARLALHARLRTGRRDAAPPTRCLRRRLVQKCAYGKAKTKAAPVGGLSDFAALGINSRQRLRASARPARRNVLGGARVRTTSMTSPPNGRSAPGSTMPNTRRCTSAR